jgi:hypothetical protein
MSLLLQPGDATRSLGRSFVLLWVECATTFVSYGTVAAVAGYSGAFALAGVSAVAAAIATGTGRRGARAFQAPALADPLTP